MLTVTSVQEVTVTQTVPVPTVHPVAALWTQSVRTLTVSVTSRPLTLLTTVPTVRLGNAKEVSCEAGWT